MRFMRTGLLTLPLLLLCLPLFAQDKMEYAGLKTSKFGGMPVLPACMTLAVQHGDPSKGPAIIAAKFTAGCKVPLHWHTAAESLVLVSGSGKAEMKDGPSQMVSPGDYVFMPAKHPHQFSCSTACVLYIMPDGAFDIHYIDKDGKEIPPEQAIKSAPMKKMAPKPKQ